MQRNWSILSVKSSKRWMIFAVKTSIFSFFLVPFRGHSPPTLLKRLYFLWHSNLPLEGRGELHPGNMTISTCMLFVLYANSYYVSPTRIYSVSQNAWKPELNPYGKFYRSNCLTHLNVSFIMWRFIEKHSQKIQVQTASGPIHWEKDNKSFQKTFPHFIWLLRDVTQSIPEDCKDINDYFFKKVRICQRK